MKTGKTTVEWSDNDPDAIFTTSSLPTIRQLIAKGFEPIHRYENYAVFRFPKKTFRLPSPPRIPGEPLSEFQIKYRLHAIKMAPIYAAELEAERGVNPALNSTDGILTPDPVPPDDW